MISACESASAVAALHRNSRRRHRARVRDAEPGLRLVRGCEDAMLARYRYLNDKKQGPVNSAHRRALNSAAKRVISTAARECASTSLRYKQLEAG